METNDNAISFQIPVIIKANLEDGKRIVTVEASNESVDQEGDVVLQKALMSSSKSFIANGHLDIDHYSEIGPRIGITNPEWYIVGYPLDVYDGGNGRTFVKGQIRQATDGSFNPNRPYDMLWEGLTSNPPVNWYASIYGYPYQDATDEFSKSSKGPNGATRYLIKGINWTSLAFTRRPVNQALKGAARIMTARSLVKIIKEEEDCWTGGVTFELPRGGGPNDISPVKKGPDGFNMPSGPGSSMAVDGEKPLANSYGIPGEFMLSHVNHGHNCMKCGGMLKSVPTLNGWRNHFVKCCNMDTHMADVHAHACMYKSLICGYYP